MNADGMNTAHSTSAIAISARADLVHALDGGLARSKPRRDVALDVLHDDDRVVDHDADREHEAEQGEIVEREAEQRHEEERADQRYRDGDQRNDRGAPGLQEDHDHQHDQRDGLEDGLLHRVDRLLDELRRVVDDGGTSRRAESAAANCCHRGADGLGGRERVRARPLEHRDARPRDRGRGRSSTRSRAPQARPWRRP